MKNADIVAESKWWKKIRQAEEEGLLPLTGDFMYLEKLKQPEAKTKGGIIIADVRTHKDTVKDRTTELGLVLAVGPGQLMEDGTLEKPRFEPGDVVEIPNNANAYDVFYWAKMETSIVRVRDSMIPSGTSNLARLQEIFNG